MCKHHTLVWEFSNYTCKKWILAVRVSSAWISNVCSLSGLCWVPGDIWTHCGVVTMLAPCQATPDYYTAITQRENEPGNSKMLVSSLHKVDIGLNATNWLVFNQCWMFLTPALARPRSHRSWWNSCLQLGVTPRYIGHCLTRLTWVNCWRQFKSKYFATIPSFVWHIMSFIHVWRGWRLCSNSLAPVSQSWSVAH